VKTEPRGKYFDDFTVGEIFTTGKRTITTTDIVNFSCLSGNFNEVHTNWEYCKESPLGEPIAHGPLVYAIVAGLGYASGLNEGNAIALLGVTDWKMLEPVKNGDTIHLEQEVVATKPASKDGKGVVTFDRRVRNQYGETVQQMTSAHLYHARCREGERVTSVH
jgi:acyl dehydratase